MKHLPRIITLIAVCAIFCSAVPARACCAAGAPGQLVVNADQTVIIIWDAATKTQHFIRQASFKSEGDDFAFLVPTPSKPELSESGNDAFPFFMKITEPERVKKSRPLMSSCGCSAPEGRLAATPAGSVTVLEEKRVAGFDAAVLETGSADALVAWLKEHGYAFSPAVQAWAKPYVESGWKITALKVAKDKAKEGQQTVAAAALRISFKTDKPIFPYREPESAQSVGALGAQSRLLRIYFIGESRYQGDLTKDTPWVANVAWSNKLYASDRTKALTLLQLPETSGPSEWWLTEFEHEWPYRLAPADVYFTRSADQATIKRPPIVIWTAAPAPVDGAVLILGAAVVPMAVRRVCARKTSR